MPADRRSGYRPLLALPAGRRLAVADLCVRVPQGMTSLTLLLVTAAHASFQVAGAVVGACTLGMAATAPLRGRLVDRHGLRPVALACLAGYLAALVALQAVAVRHGPVWPLVTLAAAAGLCTPPVSAAIRTLWSHHAGAGLRHAAFAFDAALFNLAFIAGPVIASVLATRVAPAAALGTLLVLYGVAVLVAGSVPYPARDRSGGGRDRSPGVLRNRPLRAMLLAAALTNFALSAVEVALTAYARDAHRLWASGPLLAAVSLGSVLGSLVSGSRSGSLVSGSRVSGSRGPRRLSRVLAGYATGIGALTAAALWWPLPLLAAPVAGLCLGPAMAALFAVADDAAPPGAGTETQSWVNTIMSGGAAAGAGLAGLCAGRPVLGLALAAASAALAALAALRLPAAGQRPTSRTASASPGSRPADRSPGVSGR
ncbi:MAG: MFS transporter [Mycobacteriales bacterium]